MQNNNPLPGAIDTKTHRQTHRGGRRRRQRRQHDPAGGRRHRHRGPRGKAGQPGRRLQHTAVLAPGPSAAGARAAVLQAIGVALAVRRAPRIDHLDDAGGVQQRLLFKFGGSVSGLFDGWICYGLYDVSGKFLELFVCFYG